MPRLTAGVLTFLLTLPLRAAEGPEDLWDAARKGDAKAVAALIDKGVDVNAKTRYGATALWFAAYKGREDVVRLLLDRKADVSVMDTVWGETPLSMAAGAGKAPILTALLAAGAPRRDPARPHVPRHAQVRAVRGV